MTQTFPPNKDFLGYQQNSFAIDGSDGYGRVRTVSTHVLYCSSLDLSDDAFLFNSSTATGGTGT